MLSVSLKLNFCVNSESLVVVCEGNDGPRHGTYLEVGAKGQNVLSWLLRLIAAEAGIHHRGDVIPGGLQHLVEAVVLRGAFLRAVGEDDVGQRDDVVVPIGDICM